MANEELELMKDIRDYLKVLVRLVANDATKGLTQTETVETLFGLGLETSTISQLTGIPSTTVAPIISKKRKSLAAKK